MVAKIKEHLKEVEESHIRLEVRKSYEKLDKILSDDYFVTCPTQIQTYRKEVKQGQIYTVKNSGHTPHYEAADEFCNVVTDYLTT